jgi:hypothetical protein
VLATGAGNLAHVPELATGTVASPWPLEERERLIAEFSRAPQSRDLTSAVARFLPRELVMLCVDYLGTDPLRPGPLLFRRLLRDVIPTHLVLPARVAADVPPVIRAWAHWTADRADLPKRLRRRFLSELEDDLREGRGDSVVRIRSADRIVPSRWPVDVGSVIDADHAHYALFLLDTQDDPVLAAPGASEAFQLIVQRLGDSPGILAERPVDELENRPSCVERDSPGRPCLERPEHPGREPDGVCVAHASASSWRWRSSSAARSSSRVW